MAQPSYPWIVMGLVPFFVTFFRPSGCERLQEEPPSLHTEREGGQEFSWIFVRPSRILFIQKEGLFAEPFVCEPRPLGLGKVAGRAPEPPHVATG